ncbi:MAG: DNA gyrase subunit A [Chitinophagaceae bacterium]|nr:DNA gyrase subunit A [Chitinophagaceae bacterium]
MKGEKENIIPIDIVEEMKTAYIDYSMSVIVSRALPDVRDGLKPVHRRVLYGMLELGVTYNKAYKKSARIVGEVLGKYHPHGDASVYDTMVRMAQNWSLRYPLVDGQGNFGSMDGDSPAAMRYTEARLKKITDEMVADINKKAVDFQPNFDDSLEEPTVFPAKIPNLLVNGSSGIAVGMATNMPPHNLTEIINGTIAYIENNDISIEELMNYIKAPDFPTGGIIYGTSGIRSAFMTGKGKIVIRAKLSIEALKNGREQIVITEIPYQVNKASMIEKTAQLIQEKVIEGITEVRDESDRDGLRIVYELRKDAIAQIVVNKLYKYTQLQTQFVVNNVALVKGRPQTLHLKDLIKNYIEHRHDVIIRRTKFDLEESQKKAHILEGYIIALDHLDQVITLIRSSSDTEQAKIGLMNTFQLSEIQSKSILEMRLQRLTGLERNKIEKEYEEIKKIIQNLQEILGSFSIQMSVIKNELIELREKFGDERRSVIEPNAEEFDEEDMIENNQMVITISHQGYTKRTSLAEYKIQGRGGIGTKSASTKEEDFTEHLLVANNLDYLFIFTSKGRMFSIKAYKIPESSKNSQGRAIQNIIPIEESDKVRNVINVRNLDNIEFIESHYIVLCTTNGIIKKTLLKEFCKFRTGWINAITINENDELLDVQLTNGNNEIVLASRDGQAIRFHEKEVRSMGRTAMGVIGMQFKNEEDTLIGMVCVTDPKTELLVVSEQGYGKRSAIESYRITHRNGQGVKTLDVTEKTGKLVAIKEVSPTDELMIINKSGIAIRMLLNKIRITGRIAQGVRLIKLYEGDAIASVEKIQTLDAPLPSDNEYVGTENIELEVHEGTENTTES